MPILIPEWTPEVIPNGTPMSLLKLIPKLIPNCIPKLIPWRSVLGPVDEAALDLVREIIGRLRKSDVAVFVASEVPAQPPTATAVVVSAEGRHGHGSPGQLPLAPSEIRAAVSKAALRAQLAGDFEKVSALLRAVLNASQSFCVSYSLFIIDLGFYRMVSSCIFSKALYALI